jgi:uncharacterized protein with GYD domain
MLREFVADCAAATPGEQADRLREGSALFQFIHSVRPQQVAPEVERMITLGRYDSAAIALMGPDASFTLARDAEGMVVATVVLPSYDERAVAHAPTAALALLAAYSSALLREGCRIGISPI